MLKFPSLTRITLNKKIIPIIKRYSKGYVLDVGANNSPYKRYMNYDKYSILDVNGNNPNIDFVEDIHSTSFPDNKFDTIIATEVLEHLYDPKKAVEEIHRILKPDSYFITSTRFIYPIHGAPNDYYRFTRYGLEKIFECFDKVKIIEHGSTFLSICELIGLSRIGRPLKIFNKLISKLEKSRTIAPLGYIIIAEKSLLIYG